MHRLLIALTRSPILSAAAVFLLAFVVYAASPVVTSFDSVWSVATAASLLQGRLGDLSAFAPVIEDLKGYAIVMHGDRPFTMFPIGVSLLALPFVALASWIDPAFLLDIRFVIPLRFEQLVASFYAALAVAVFAALVRARFDRPGLALATGLILAFGTSMWSVASRALWQHGPLVLFLSAALLILVRSETRPRLLPFAALPLAAAFVVRPTSAIFIVCLSAYVLTRGVRPFLRFALLGAGVGAGWAAFNVASQGTVFPGYYSPARLAGESTFWTALAGNLVSPARGLFVWSPILLLAFYGASRALHDRSRLALHLAMLVAVALHLVAISSFTHWWAGHSLGPRFMTDTLPVFGYFLAYGLDALSRQPRRLVRTAALAGAGVLAATSSAIHAQAALRVGPLQWNGEPVNVDSAPSRLWDWTDLQFMRGGAMPPRHPAIHLRGKRSAWSVIHGPDIDMRHGLARSGRLDRGWRDVEAWGVWGSGGRSELTLFLRRVPTGEDLRLHVLARMSAEAGAATAFRVEVAGEEVARWRLEADAAVLEAVIPGRLAAGRETLPLAITPEAPATTGIGLVGLLLARR